MVFHTENWKVYFRGKPKESLKGSYADLLGKKEWEKCANLDRNGSIVGRHWTLTKQAQEI